MNYCIPTNRSFCSPHRVSPRPKSKEARERMQFFKTHTFEVHTNRKTGEAYMVVKDKVSGENR